MILDEINAILIKEHRKEFKEKITVNELHLGCDSWPECEENIGGCYVYWDFMERMKDEISQ